jgi:hypothetical protein
MIYSYCFVDEGKLICKLSDLFCIELTLSEAFRNPDSPKFFGASRDAESTWSVLDVIVYVKPAGDLEGRFAMRREEGF